MDKPVSPRRRPNGILTNHSLSQLSAKNSLEPKASKQPLTGFNRWILGLKATGFLTKSSAIKKKNSSNLELGICFIIKERKQENVLQSCESSSRDGKGNTSRRGTSDYLCVLSWCTREYRGLAGLLLNNFRVQWCLIYPGIDSYLSCS